jgi:hypothetical protein
LEEDNLVIKDLKAVTTKLKKVQEEEFNKSTMLTRLMVLDTKSSPMETFTKPAVEDTPATDNSPPPAATETSPTLEPGGHKPALKDIMTTFVVFPEQNRKTTKNNHAAQVQVTFSKVGALLTDDDDAFTVRAFTFNPDLIGPISDDTKSERDPESDNPYSSSRHRFVEPMDKLPMTATAWDKIHIFAGMASNKMVQCVKPFRMRKPDEDEKGEYDKFYGSSADKMLRTEWP